MSTGEITVTINGEARTCEAGLTLLSWLELAGVNPAQVVAEHNGEIVKPDSFAQRELKAGDTVEFIRFVGGG